MKIVNQYGKPIARKARRRAFVRVIPSKFVRGIPPPTPESEELGKLASEMRRREQTRQRALALRLQ